MTPYQIAYLHTMLGASFEIQKFFRSEVRPDQVRIFSRGGCELEKDCTAEAPLHGYHELRLGRQ